MSAPQVVTPDGRSVAGPYTQSGYESYRARCVAEGLVPLSLPAWRLVVEPLSLESMRAAWKQTCGRFGGAHGRRVDGRVSVAADSWRGQRAFGGRGSSWT